MKKQYASLSLIAAAVGVLAVASPLSATASTDRTGAASQVVVSDVPCGYDPTPNATWNNCSGGREEIRITWIDHRGRGGHTDYCANPGVTYLSNAIGGIGYPTGAFKIRDRC
ncbi:hypothetical protein [Amycolatopsis suaedae]|uniref:Uncharacterized protein n=1 Tax=Amycolatopsis suaedae TaxID=2510978 RepID=A0A4Q7J2C0_9PSEU|nr:hypothetical protein [Amycolatopsis suaedae]RZQ61037.1 hypothetical protein EWH70_26620 [Amycolatopsis suaedae]